MFKDRQRSNTSGVKFVNMLIYAFLGQFAHWQSTHSHFSLHIQTPPLAVHSHEIVLLPVSTHFPQLPAQPLSHSHLQSTFPLQQPIVRSFMFLIYLLLVYEFDHQMSEYRILKKKKKLFPVFLHSNDVPLRPSIYMYYELHFL